MKIKRKQQVVHWISSIVVLFLLSLLPVPMPGAMQENSTEKGNTTTQTAEPVPVEQVPEVQDNPITVAELDTGPIVSYLIEAQLLPEARKLTANQTLSWRNTSTQAIDHLRFHLYYNGFRNINSTFLTEGRFYTKSKEEQKKLKFGEIVIKEIRRINGADLSAAMKFIAPDDGNENDRTVMELKLDAPVEPGQTIRLKFQFILTIPQIFARTGMQDDYFFFGQWFPKIGVLQEDGQWHCHQFHRFSEFYANYGEYKVALTLPERFKIGATGNMVKKEKNVDETVTYFYEEKNIHDFAWTASPNFTRVMDKIKLPGNNTDTAIELLLSPGHVSYKSRHLESLKFAMDFFARYVYPYPYKKITAVDPPINAMESGGMEYPTLITTDTIGLMPDALKLPEIVTVHEFGHEYWYGIVGTDEFREAWLDEGVNSFFEGEILSEYFKNQGSAMDFFFLKVNGTEVSRLSYAMLQPVDPVKQESWKFMNGMQYSSNVYQKAAVFLRSLRNLVGKERMYNFFKYYVNKYKFKHPTSDDFIETFNTFMNEDYTWAFDLYIRGSGGLNHAVESIQSHKLSSKPLLYRNEVIFIRQEGYFPVELQIILENRKEIKSFWTEQEKWKKIVFDDPSPIKQAVIDPYYKVPLDKNYLDNSKVMKPKKSGIKRLALKLGFMFQTVLSFFAF